MATYTNAIAVSGAVAATNSGGTLYTCPANSYAIINVYAAFTGLLGGSISVGGQTYPMVFSNGSGGSGAVWTLTFHVGPGQAVVNTGGGTVAISGVQFTNGA